MRMHLNFHTCYQLTKKALQSHAYHIPNIRATVPSSNLTLPIVPLELWMRSRVNKVCSFFTISSAGSGISLRSSDKGSSSPRC